MKRSPIDEKYERKMLHPWTQELYGHSDFYNFGYWEERTLTQKEASENLVDILMSFIPNKKGIIVDVACGMGATTGHLLRYYQADHLIGLNISPSQLQRGKANAPGCSFVLMDAVHLAFPDQSIDNIICVEAAFHFNTREAFLAQAFRVLKPGGHIVLSDILSHHWAAKLNFRTPSDNWAAGLDSYSAIYRRIGFCDVLAIDATAECWDRFLANAKRWREGKLRQKEMSRSAFLGIALRHRIAAGGLHYYLLVSAVKPEAMEEAA